MSPSRKFALLTLASALATGTGLQHPASAQSPPITLGGGSSAKLSLADADTEQPARSLTVAVNKTYLLEFDVEIDDIIVANPTIASITVRDRRHIAVMGVTPGDSNVVFLDASGRKLLVLDVSVTDGVVGLDQLRNLIRRYVPDSKVQVEGVNGKIILAGSVPNISANARVEMLAKQYGKSDDSVLNLMTIDGKDQVALKVRIVEMQRSVVKQLGVNLSGGTSFGELEPRQLQNALDPLTGVRAITGDVIDSKWANNQFFSSSAGFGVNGSALGGLAANIGYQNIADQTQQSAIGASLNALERIGVLRTLAEPNLTALSGEAAKFLAGGEFPVPVAQENGSISIQFKPFGVSLGFTPVVRSEGRISLLVDTEVSELTQQGGFQSRTTSGIDPTTGQAVGGQTISVPALKVRRATTTVELPSGGSLVIAGLIQEQTRQSLDGVPGAKDLPVLGALFRSRDFLNDETEMVVIVTPYLVDPTDPQNLRAPDNGFVTPKDLRAILFGKLNEVYAVPGSAASKVSAPRGASGFIVD